MKVVVSGYFGHGNTGDEAILAGMLSAMRSADPTTEAIVISADPEQTRKTHEVDAVPRLSAARIWQALRSADGLISGGGGLLQDRTSARPVAYYAGVMGLALMARRPYVVHAQGLGPILRRANRAIAATALRGAAKVSLRDAGSIALARAMGVRRAIDLVPDPALVLQPRRGHGGHLLVAVRAWGASDRAFQSIREAVGVLGSAHRVIVLPMHEPLDREPSRLVAEGVAGASVVPASTPLDERLALIGSAGLVIGMRLHAIVLAAAASVPAVAVSYDPKVDAFASQVGIPVAGDVGSNVDAAAIVDAARRELGADLSRRNLIVAAMRDTIGESIAASLNAIREGTGGRKW